jgi:hypothetical protein
LDQEEFDMRYRSIDHLIRNLVADGAGLGDDHPWRKPGNTGVHAGLLKVMSETLRGRAKGSSVTEGEDILQQELALGTMFRRTGETMAPRLFSQEPAILLTTKTPLLQWLQRRAVDVGRDVQRQGVLRRELRQEPQGGDG